MKYNGIELKDFTSDKPVVFDPPKKMLVWRGGDDPVEAFVYAYVPDRRFPVICDTTTMDYCAEIPEESKTRRATKLELAKWLAQGNGWVAFKDSYYEDTHMQITKGTEMEDCSADTVIRKWDDTEWHEPTADYMGLED